MGTLMTTGKGKRNKGFSNPYQTPNTQMGCAPLHIVTMTENILIQKQQWLDIPHACQVADVSPSTMRLLIKAGVLRACQLRVPGKVWGKWIINKESLLGFLDKLAANQRKVKIREEVKT
jgi:hypothetical protein